MAGALVTVPGPSPSEAWSAYVAARGIFLADPSAVAGNMALRSLGAFCVASDMDAAETRETLQTAMGSILARLFAA